jgi:hypothetical protein
MSTIKIVPCQELPAGEYVITDPCYVIKGKEWKEFCDLLPNARCNGMVKHGIRLFWFGSTAYGSGSYTVRYRGEIEGHFGVVSSIYGIFPVEMVKELAPELLTDTRLACVVTSKGGDVAYSNGDIEWQGTTVYTNDCAEDNEECEG